MDDNITNNDIKDPIIGRTLGDFLIKEKLGEGGFGTVYKTRQITLARDAVIKILHTRHRTDPQIIERFKREAQLASRLEHPYCAHIYSFGAESDGLLWIAMELVAGTPLDEVLSLQGAFPLERFIPLLDKICEVVQTAHDTGIIHRDLKPANIMIISRAGRLLPKLLDFGIAKDLSLQNNSTNSLNKTFNIESEINTLITRKVTSHLDDSNYIPNTAIEVVKNRITTKEEKTLLQNELEKEISSQIPTLIGMDNDTNENRYFVRTEGMMGSPRYMAPELWENAVKADTYSDIYSLGVIAYELLTARPPFSEVGYDLALAHKSKPVPPLGKTFSPVLDSIIAKAMAKNPEKRYQSALEFAKDFREAAGFSEQQINLPQLNELLKEDLLTNAPKPIADTVASLLAARNVYQFRDRILLVFSVLVRYVSILTLASYSRINNNQENNELINKALADLRKQSLSNLQWAELSRELCRPFAKKRDVYPIPELVNLFFASDSENLSSFTGVFADLLQLQHEIDSSASLAEEELINLLNEFLSKLNVLLKETNWLSSYYLVLPESQQATKWMGSLKETGTIAIKNNNLDGAKVILVDSQGYFVLSLWPLVQITRPTPGAIPEVFLLEGKGRTGTKLVSFPNGFEIEEESPWLWFKEHFLTEEEKKQTGMLIEKSPYLGLTTFSSMDSALFFGREKETIDFLNRLRIQPLLAVVGPSGAGKSSFIQAGVIASLAENWQVLTVRPGLSPLATLAAKLAKLGVELTDLRAELQKDRKYLAKILRQFASKQKSMLLLVVDQFEEIITLCLDKEEQRLYVEAIALAASSEEDPIRVVLTMRDDFLVRVKELKGLKDHLAQALEILTTPDTTELLRILTEPAKRAGYEFDDQELPVEIVDAVAGQTSALPLIAFTASKLWEQRDKEFKQLRRRSYELMGGVAGALARHAEEILMQMSQTEQLLVREAFHHLITSEGTKAVLTRPEILQLLGKTNDSEMVLEKLISARLLVATEGEKEVDKIEIVHEALISVWPRLVKWRQETAEGARLRDQLRAAARQWQERKRPKGLLWRDEALTEYQLWRSHYKGKLTELEEEFIGLSLSDASRNQQIKKALVIAAILILIFGSTLLFYQQQKTKQQLLKTLELYEEQGRQEILKGNLDNAAVYLSEAYAQGASSLPLRYMLSIALAKVENRPPIVLSNHTAAVMTAVFSPDDQLIVSVSADKTAKIWQVVDGKELFTLKGHTETVLTAQFSPDGKFIVTASLDNTAKIWKTQDASLITTLAGHSDGLRTAIFSLDGKQILTTSYDHTAKIWDSTTGKLLNTLTGHKGAIYAASYSNDGKLIATASADKTIKIWDSNNASLKASLNAHQASVNSVMFSPDDKLLVTASADKTAKIWQISENKLLHTLVGHKNGVTSAKFSLDGKTILTTSKDKTSCLWDSKTGNLISTLLGHEQDIATGEFSSDGELIITSSYDNTARIWEKSTGKFLVTLSAHEAGLVNAKFSNDGKKVITASLDKTIRIWNVVAENRPPEEIVLIVKEKVPIDLKEGRLVLREQKIDVKEVENKVENIQIGNKANENIIIEILDNGVTIEMVKIEGGTFEMGSPLNEEGRNADEKLHTVTVSPFYIGKYEVTQAQWNAVANLPMINTFLLADPSDFKGANLPVEKITWGEAVEFCARLSKFTGKTYRLPTEAEWEYAARAGTKDKHAGDLDKMAWYGKNSKAQTHIVGQKQPNAWGLYDTHGNVWEWCQDWYGDYSSVAEIDPKGASSGTSHIARGGSWLHTATHSRLANRATLTPDVRVNGVGFRLVRSLK
ncbi:MAG: SUMF1/EgtB/PvdO family nonheme iron enzyme [Acidobacteria bacterium]|nr:SUMF1/EgtB/PvdO family nonheme iron enzyme [Acidobacteriota bacterium]